MINSRAMLLILNKKRRYNSRWQSCVISSVITFSISNITDSSTADGAHTAGEADRDAHNPAVPAGEYVRQHQRRSGQGIHRGVEALRPGTPCSLALQQRDPCARHAVRSHRRQGRLRRQLQWAFICCPEV